ncbi:benzoate transporter [Aeromonas cavernicola]|uniref:Benzoate transporter n=2 Tax=Aeromonas cavernicola TaxID=1006623 RepID=A0A2H9U6N2_9GAMM|nr:benzoate transporter [Aeromonas cavernicola]
MFSSSFFLHLKSVLHPVVAGFVSIIVGYGSTFVLILQAAKAANLSPELTASWVWSASIGAGVTGLFLSWRHREPIITAWSTPAIAFLITAFATTSYAEAIGAYMISAAAFIVLGLSGYFEKLIRIIPSGIAAGLLAGILLQFGVAAFGTITVEPILAGFLMVIYVLLKRFTARYAVLGIFLLGLGFLLLQQRMDLSDITFAFAKPVFTFPVFSIQALLSVAIPIFLITLTGQYMPGILVLRNDSFKTSANTIVAVTGLGSLIMSVFGSTAVTSAAITAAICTGKEAHEDPSKRWIAGISCGLLYVLIGIFGVTLARIFMAFPNTFIAILAGLALLGTIVNSLSTAMAEAKSREAALITFVATAANIKFLGIGGAFWGALIGLFAYVFLNGDFSKLGKYWQR